MSWSKYIYVFLLSLSLMSFLVFMHRQTKDGHQRYVSPKTQSSNPETGPQLNSEEHGRCEGKIHTSPMPLKLKIRQDARKKLVHDMCSNSDMANTLDIGRKWQTFDQIPQSELNNLLVDDRHGIIYCYVPKVGCTAWKGIMIVLSESLKVHGVPYRVPADIPYEQVHGSSVQHLNAYPKEVMKQKLETYKKFMFVRDPFVRLISAYRDKMQTTNNTYYKGIRLGIVKKFGNFSIPPASFEKAHADGIVPSFYDFIQYILSLAESSYTKFDEHWRQVIHLCHPCLIDYDFIGKMETIDEDAAQLLRILHVDNIVGLRPLNSTKTEQSWTKTWFANIPMEWRRKLYKVYEADFRLFGYKYEDLDDFVPENVI